MSIVVSMFLSALNQTIVGTAMRTIADELGGLSLQAWVTTAFLIASTVSTPIYGKLSDVLGRRPLMLAAIVIFATGSVLSSFSQDMIQLAAFRAVQGLGAGGLMSLPLAILADMFAPKERARYQGLFMAAFGVASVAGPLIGGLFAGMTELLWIPGWRWVFLINVPLISIAFVLVSRFLHLPRKRAAPRIDYGGATLVALIVVPLILVAEQGAYWGWASVASISCYAIVAVAFVAFVFVERHMGRDALIPLRLFASRAFTISVLLSVLVGFAMFSVMTTLPLYIQVVMELSPTNAGLAQLPLIGSQLITSSVIGFVYARLNRAKWVVVACLVLLTVAFAVLGTLHYNDPLWKLYLPMVLFGASLGGLLQGLTLVLQNSVDASEMGVATSASSFFRSIGGTLGTGITFSLLFGTLTQTIPAALRSPQHAGPVADALAEHGKTPDTANARIVELLEGPSQQAAAAMNGDTSFLIGSDDRLVAPFIDAFNNSLVFGYWLALVMVAAALVLSLALPNTRFRTASALQELHQRGDLGKSDSAAS
jgi:EmrB/QacA subfamily drug resistance transporter